MLLSFIEVRDLNRFLEYLKSGGIDVEEYAHMVLPDSSEYEIIICRKNTDDIAYIAAHYIDNHYAALAELPDNASDSEVLKALLSVNKNHLWRVPVEPLAYVSNSYEFIRYVLRYVDDVPEEAKQYLTRYINSYNSVGKIIDASMLLRLADRLSRDRYP